jgi:hypothetical protein
MNAFDKQFFDLAFHTSFETKGTDKYEKSKNGTSLLDAIEMRLNAIDSDRLYQTTHKSSTALYRQRSHSEDFTEDFTGKSFYLWQFIYGSSSMAVLATPKNFS